MRPWLELRVRGEFRRHPPDLGGKAFESSAVLLDAPGSREPAVAEVAARATDEATIAERLRLGLAADRGFVTAAIALQDSRRLGASGLAVDVRQRPVDDFGVWQAWIDLHQTKKRGAFLRIGRQRVVFGDGRLIGESDWSARPRALDAVRGGVSIGDIDIQALAALLAAPGSASSLVSEAGSARTVSGSGAQLYGLDAIWHLMPPLSLELTTLARIVREPRGVDLLPSDTYVVDLRAFGERRGLQWAVEGAYEAGRVATFGGSRDLSAFAAAARAALETSLWTHPTFGIHGAFASGSDAPAPTGALADGAPPALHRFDPILPDSRGDMGRMGSWAWSNVVSGGADVSVAPTEDVSAIVGWRVAALVRPADRWTTADLAPVGHDPTHGDRLLGNEIDAEVRWSPWEGLALNAGYGVLFLGRGARNVLAAAQRCVGSADTCAEAEHWGYVSVLVRAP